MVTNREKYIKYTTNWDLAELIVHRLDRCVFCVKRNDCEHINQPLGYRLYEFCRTQIKF